MTRSFPLPDDTPAPLRTASGGTSQRDRTPAALSPEHVLVDELDTSALLRIGRGQAQLLSWFDATDKPNGTWAAFLPDEVDLDRLAAALADPSSATGTEAEHMRRPHVALYLTFLRLLGYARDELNTVPRRHLDFFYRDVLGLTNKRAHPDRVDVLLGLAPGVESARLPAGTLLTAGTDEEQRERLYATDRDIVVNRASVADLRSVSLQQRVTTLDDLGQDGRPESVLSMLRLALGEPVPGPDPVLPRLDGDTVDLDLLRRLDRLIRRSADTAHLPLQQLRSLVRLKRARDVEDPLAWAAVAQILTTVALRRDPDFPGGLTERPGDFEVNLAAALGGPPDYRALQQVTTFDDLWTFSSEPAVARFITAELHFTMAELEQLCQLKRTSDTAWAQINAILDDAGKAADPSFHLASRPGFDPRAYAENVQLALGDLDPEPYWTQLEGLETWFAMSIESLAFLTTAAGRSDGPTDAEWQALRTLLTMAHRARLLRAVPGRLDSLRADTTLSQRARLAGMLRLALGEQAPRDAPFDRLLELLTVLDQKRLAPLVDRADRDQLTDIDWAEAVAVLGALLAAQTASATPVARAWGWLHARADATAAVPATTAELDPGTARWRTFGDPDEPERPAAPPPVVGLAVSSPTLAAGGGSRTLSVTLGFAPETFTLDPARLDAALIVELSTAAGWTRPARTDVRAVDFPATAADEGQARLAGLRVTAVVAPDADPIAALDDGSGWPDAAMRLMLAPVRDHDTGAVSTPHHAEFARLQLVAVHVTSVVDVPDGQGPALPGLVARTDDGPVDPSAPFEPFGTAPVVGSRLRVGAAELVGKLLDTVTLRLEWLGAPTNLVSSYYNGYDSSGAATTHRPVTATVRVVRSGRAAAASPSSPLFDTADATRPVLLSVGLEDPGPGPLLSLAPGRRDLLEWPAYLQIELDTIDFLHGQYPSVMARKAMQLAAAMARPGGPADAAAYAVSPPYTPRLKSLSLGYSASSHIDLRAPEAQSPDRLWHVHPFGRAELPHDGGPVPLLPTYENAGELYLGLTEVRAPQSVALLFQVAEGSADADLPAPVVEWSYLSGGGWRPLSSGQVVSDSTQGFLNSGIVELALPANAPSQVLPAGRYWLRAAVKDNARAVSDMIGIHAQAVPATYVDNGSLTHHARPLPAGTISRLHEGASGVATVRQPYSSAGGVPQEQSQALDRRASERLRHRGRAVTTWDYERLVLEQFPDVSRVKCLPSDGEEPGQVDLVVLPDIRHRNPFDPFEPKVPADRLRAIDAFLSDRVSPSVRLRVRNARFLSIRVRVNVRFRPGADQRYFIRQLNSDLDRFLSPWAFDDGADIVIGGQLWVGSIVAFVDGQPYVDHVDGAELLAKDGRSPYWLPMRTAVGVQAPDTVMVSAGSHEIVVLADEHDTGERWTGVGYMAVQVDLAVG